MANELLTVWALGALGKKAADFQPGPLTKFVISYTKERGFSVAGANWIRLDDTDNKREAITLVGVAWAAFHSGTWPDDGVPNLSLRTIADLPDPHSLNFERLSFIDDDSMIRAWPRLTRTCALPGSIVRLTRLLPADLDPFEAQQWLSFRFALLDPLMLNQPPSRGETLSAEDAITAAGTGFSGSSSTYIRALRQESTAAEFREVLARRTSYIAGGFRHTDRNTRAFESFAANAAAPGVFGGAFPLATIERLIPAKKDRWGSVSRLGDGFWWAWDADSVRPSALKLSDALANLKCFPPEPQKAGVQPIVTRLERAKPEQVAQIAVLDLLGLRAAPVLPIGTLPDRGGGTAPPYHYLHMRQNGATLEWRRWVALRPPANAILAPGQAEARTPALIRVRREAGAAGSPGALRLSVEGLTDAHFLDLWSRKVAEPLRATARREGGTRGVSLVPDLFGNAAETGVGLWSVEFELEEPWTPAEASKGPLFLGRYRLLGATLMRTKRTPDMSLLGNLAYLDSPVAEAHNLATPLSVAGFAFPDLHTHDQSADGASALGFNGPIALALAAGTQPLALKFDVGRDSVWRLATSHSVEFNPYGPQPVAVAGGKGRSIVAIGGLDVQFGSGLLDRCKLAVKAAGGTLDYEFGNDAKPVALPVKDVQIGGSDLDASDIDIQPLLWGQSFMDEGVLCGRDFRAAQTNRRSLTFDLRPSRAGPSNGTAEITLIDPAPMLVAKVSAKKLASPNETKESAASWNAGEGLWRLTPLDDKPPEITLALPPQGVAEAWERSKLGDTYLGPDQIEEGARVPARLPPVTALRIEGDERARNPIAPWNLREIMGFSDADLPGARITAIERIELLYGLEGWAPRLTGIRLAEMAGWRGVPREVTSKDAGRKQVWQAARKAWTRRLAVLDARDERDTAMRPTIGNLRYRLRTKAGDQASYVKPAIAVDSDPALWTDGTDGGILGGAFAGFEQPSLVKTLHGRRDGEGVLDGLQLSALGAWTRPRAAFDNGLTLISSEVQMGRVCEARFERKGRIGALHHIAKHVIVYRRIFLPSRQFAAEQDWQLGRPIVRKVEEYIELTEPVRSYPDRVGASAMNAGPLLGIRFRTIRIPVHGSWASPLRDPRVEGYSIPLWREGADPDIYPLPAIEALLAGDPNRSEPEPLARRIRTPDRLRFYTITSMLSDAGEGSPSGDIEQWPLIYDMDFVDRALDDPTLEKIQKSEFQVAGAPQVKLPSSPSAAPGIERFTLELEAGPGVNVMQARAQHPMIADLRSVLVMRAQAPDRTVQIAAEEGAQLRKVAGAAPIAFDLAVLADNSDQHTQVGALKTEILTRLNALKAQLPETSPLNSAELCGWAHAPANQLAPLVASLDSANPGNIVAQIDRLWGSGRAELLTKLRSLQTDVDALLPLDGAVAKMLAPFIDQANAAVAEIKGELTVNLGVAKTAIGNVAADWDHALAQASTNIGDLRNELAADKAEGALSQLRGRVAEAVRSVQTATEAIGKALPKLDEAVAQLRKNAPKVAKAAPKASARMVELAANLEAARAEIAKVQKRVADELPARLSAAESRIVEWTRIAGAVPQAARDALLQVEAGIVDLRDAINDAKGAAQALLGRIPREISTILDAEISEAIDLLADSAEVSLEVIEANLRIVAGAGALLRKQAVDAALPPGVRQALIDTQDAIKVPLGALHVRLKTAGTGFCDILTRADTLANELFADWKGRLDALIREVDQYAGTLIDLQNKLDGYAKGIGSALTRLRSGIEDVLDGKLLDTLLGQPVQPQGLGQAVALNLLRAAGAPPIVEQLAFNRDQIAYHFEAEARRVIITPVTALVDQADQALRGVGLALPTLGIDETLLAPAHQAFNDLRNAAGDVLDGLEMRAKEVLKDFAGLKDLLPNLDFNSKLAGAIRVTHDYDAARNTAWFQAEINYGPETQDLFRHDLFAVVAEQMVLSGVSRYERGLSGGESRSVKASLVSNWQLIVGGMPLVRIRDAAIRYDESGGLKFDIRPENIEFPGALQLLTQLLTSLSGTNKPLTLELLNDPVTGRPIGLKSRYDLPPTAFSVGAVAVFNAALGVHLDLAQRSEFEIRSFAYFGSRKSPFAMTVSLLGGGGYVEAEAIHRPASRRTDLMLRVGIGLAAGTGFSFGPLRGSVQLYLGFEASFASGSAGSHVSVTAIFVLSGSVTAWGFVTVSLGVSLMLTYDGAKMLGHGEIDVEVRISRFYKKSFSRSITYRL